MWRILNVWPPLLFAGIRVVGWDDDYSRVKVRLAKSWLTSNNFGTQFGGSLYSMTDPFFAIMLMQRIGHDFTVWDQRGEIEYVSPGRTAVTAELLITAEDVAEVIAAATGGEKVLRWFECEVLGTDGVVVARVRKQLYIRRKRPA
jgi:acyl-coenzyme A thioesterase PaaI-like protein